MKVTTDAVQVLGGYGYTRDFPVERYMREAKVMQIFEGTNQIQRMVIGRALAKDDARHHRCRRFAPSRAVSRPHSSREECGHATFPAARRSGAPYGRCASHRPTAGEGG